MIQLYVEQCELTYEGAFVKPEFSLVGHGEALGLRVEEARALLPRPASLRLGGLRAARLYCGLQQVTTKTRGEARPPHIRKRT